MSSTYIVFCGHTVFIVSIHSHIYISGEEAGGGGVATEAVGEIILQILNRPAFALRFSDAMVIVPFQHGKLRGAPDDEPK